MNRTEEFWAAAQRAYDKRLPALEDESVLAGLEAKPEELAALVRLDQALAHLRELDPAPPSNPTVLEEPPRSWPRPLVAAAAALVLALLAGWWTSAEPAPTLSTPSGDQAHPIVHRVEVRVETVRHAPRQPHALATLNSRPPSVSTRTQTWKVRRSRLTSAPAPSTK